MPPGSRPGIKTFATAPTNNPTRIIQSTIHLPFFSLWTGLTSKVDWRGGARPDIEASQDTPGVGQVADNLSNGQGPFSYDGRHGDDLIVSCDLRILHQVDHIDMVAAGEMFFADPMQIAKSGDRFWVWSGDIEAQVPMLRRRFGRL